MKKLFFLLTLVIISASFTACKKSSTTESLTPAQLVQNKWHYDKENANDHYLGMDHFHNTVGTSADYLDFRADGKVYSYVSGYRDTVSYAMSGNDKIVIDNSLTFDIKTLTSNAFTIYTKDVSGSDFYETTIWMSR